MHHLSVAVIGAGTIGTGWAVLFANAGFEVRLYDANPGAVQAARDRAEVILKRLQEDRLCENARRASSNLVACATFDAAVTGSAWLQESVTEDAEIKSALFKRAGKLNRDAILASSTSAIDPKQFLSEVINPGRCIVAHPFNPPYLIPLVELVAAPATSRETIQHATSILKNCGMAPVTVRKPVAGFVANRLQAAVINEAMHLIESGVIDPDGLDRCMTDALALRWAFIGPLATMDLNTVDGVEGYISKFGRSYEALGCDLGVAQPWGESAREAVIQARRAALPKNSIEDAVARRDQAIVALLRLREKLEQDVTCESH